MANRKSCDEHKATTANAVRRTGGAGLSELGLREEDKAARLLVSDSWFASTETADASKKELGVQFVKNAKTAMKVFSLEQLRWGFSKTERGVTSHTYDARR